MKGEVPWIDGVIVCDIIAALLVVESLKYLNTSMVSLLSALEGHLLAVGFFTYGLAFLLVLV